MGLIDLHHVAIKTKDLDETVKFYTKVLGMKVVHRPKFDFPGAWLQMGGTMFHIYAGHAAKDMKGGWKYSQMHSPLDHVALRAKGFDKMKKKIVACGREWRQQDLPHADIWQLFVLDPSGIKIEINFTTSQEPKGSKGPDNRYKKYVAGTF
jgi:catechol 2,3-dioxygenase-like lactoylglutathione lyase family enzyme